MKDPKTTALGLLTIIVALAGAVITYLQTGNAPGLETLMPSLLAGWGLLHASDSKPSSPVQSAILKAIPLFFAAGLVLQSCATPAGKNVSAYLGSPAGQKVIGALENAALAAGVNALEQYSNGGDVNTNAIGLAALEGGTLGLRSMETNAGTPPNASQIASVLTSFGGSPEIAAATSPALAAAISKAVSKGLPASTAIEHAAVGLDAVPAIEAPISSK